MDLRGNGKSFRPEKYEDYALDKFAQDLFNILKKEKIKKVIIISHCFGNLVSIEFLKKHKKMVKSMIFISAYANQCNRKITKMIFPMIVPLNTLKYIPTLRKNGYNLDYREYTPARDWDIKRMVMDISNTGMKPFLFILGHIFNTDFEKYIKKIKVPVLIIHGEKDTVIPVECGIDFRNQIKNSKISIIKNANHLLVLNNKKEVLNQIKKFINKLE